MSPPFKQILVADAETRWSSKPAEWCPDAYTLKKLTTEEYIRNPLFKAFGFCFKWYGEEGNAIWIPHWKLPEYLSSIDWTTTAICCHNAQFDAAILSWHYGIRPAFIFDTLSMARALRGLEVGNSAFKLAQDFGLPPKGNELVSSDGLYDLPLEVEVKLANYCRHDTWLCEQFLMRMLPGFPAKELRLIDMTIRMFTEPQLELDTNLLADAIREGDDARGSLLARLGVDEAQLASNDKFAESLRALGVEPPTKQSKTTGEETFAFAKNDALFLELVNSDREEIALLCEARMRVKSTQERTRAQRFLDIASRGRLPVPVNYAHTRTLRWGAAKGSNINMQNLKRGGKLRLSIVAPDDHEIVAGDLSQIEPRVLAYLSDYTELLEIFASGKDAYAQFGAQMFGIPGLNKDDHPDLRQSAKSALLGCFAADTQVLTNSGWKSIVSVLQTDLLWDGEEWVRHTGVLNQGVKTTFRHRGVAATEDHEILTAHGWREWSEVRTNHSLFQSALALANLPSSTGAEPSYSKATKPHPLSHTYDARADGKGLSREAIFNAAGLPDATPAQNKKQQKPASTTLNTRLLSKIRNIACDCSTAFQQSFRAALTLAQQRFQITAGGVSTFIRSGSKTVQSFFDTSSRCPDGTTQAFSLTASTTTAVTFPATYDSAHAARTCLINAKLPLEKSNNCGCGLQNLSEKLPTYDISNAGPRNRFTILTDDGPIIVHNCGYQLGWASFAAQLLTGFLGAPPVRYDRAFAKRLGIGRAEVVAFVSGDAGKERLLRMAEIPHTCTDEELLVHCVCAKEIIDRYRRTSSPVVDFWAFLERMIATVLAVPDAEPVVYKCLTFKPGAIILPNGLPILYEKVKVELDEKKRPRYSYWNGKKYKNLYAGVVAENVTSGTARCVIADGMLRIQPKYRCAMPVHDEGVWVVPKAEVGMAISFIKQAMTMPVSYLPGIPLGASVGHARRYGEAK